MRSRDGKLRSQPTTLGRALHETVDRAPHDLARYRVLENGDDVRRTTKLGTDHQDAIDVAHRIDRSRLEEAAPLREVHDEPTDTRPERMLTDALRQQQQVD